MVEICHFCAASLKPEDRQYIAQHSFFCKDPEWYSAWCACCLADSRHY